MPSAKASGYLGYSQKLDLLRLNTSKFAVGGHPYAHSQRHRDASATKNSIY
jgi:hypothetical protein